MITATKNPDGTITITCDEETAGWFWNRADEESRAGDITEHGRQKAKGIADTIFKAAEWKDTDY